MKRIALLAIVPLIMGATWPTTELECLAANIYHEARGESIHGQWLVAYVTKNRVDSPRYPSTYCAVVKQPAQFSWYHGVELKPRDKKAWEVSVSIALHFILGDPISQVDASRGAMYYHTISVKPKWAKEKTYIGRVGKHLAYK